MRTLVVSFSNVHEAHDPQVCLGLLAFALFAMTLVDAIQARMSQLVASIAQDAGGLLVLVNIVSTGASRE